MTEIRICFVGDSITMGQNDRQCLGWPGRLSALESRNGHQISCYNLGVRGDTSDDISDRWRQECDARLPENARCGIIFMFGINDMADQDSQGVRVPLQRSLNNARKILGAASVQRRCLWIGPTPVRGSVVLEAPHRGVTYQFAGERVVTLNEAYRNLANQIQIPFLDLHQSFAGSQAWRDVLADGDGVHPTSEGYEFLANAIGQWQGWRRMLDAYDRP